MRNKEKTGIEELYGSKDYQRGLTDGIESEKRKKIPKPPKLVVVEKIVKVTRKDHPRSRFLKFGVVSKGQLLNRTFATRDEAIIFREGLRPMWDKGKVLKLEAEVIKLF